MTKPSAFRTGLLVVLGAGVMCGGIVALLFFAQSSLQVAHRNEAEAFAGMDAVRARLGGQEPCLDRDRDAAAAVGPGQSRPASVQMLAWEREDNRLVRVTTPYWALRAGSWKINAARIIAPPLDHVKLVDLERCGPGLILDRRTAGGGRVLIWTE